MELSVLVQINLVNLVLSLVTGITLQYVFNDLSKNSGFLVTNKKQQFTIIAHIFMGMIVGLLLLPVRYTFEPTEKESSKLPKSVLYRQSAGLLIFFIYTIRNFWKHPKNLKKKMKKCGLDHKYSFFKSSVTRQQMQLLLGISLSTIPALFIMKKSKQKITNTSIIFLTISGLSWLQIIAQFVNEHKVNYDLKRQILKCAGR